MSTKPMKPLNKPNAQVKVDLRDAETIKCSDCSNYLFIVSIIKSKFFFSSSISEYFPHN